MLEEESWVQRRARKQKTARRIALRCAFLKPKGVRSGPCVPLALGYAAVGWLVRQPLLRGRKKPDVQRLLIPVAGLAARG